MTALLAPVAFASASSIMPQVDFARMGVVAVGGSFAGLDFYTANETNTFDGSTSTLLSRALSNGTTTAIASTNAGGSIHAVCSIGNTIYIGGSFSSLSGAAYTNIASYDTGSHQLAAMQSGLDGTVYSLYCDPSASHVWAGGDFHAPVGADATQYGGSVAIFDAKASTWSAPGFFGLKGDGASVRTIAPGTGSASSALYFGGSFLTSFASNVTVNSTNNPNVPYSPGATPFSSSLVPIPLDSSDVDANPSTSEAGYTNITNILCPAGADGPNNTWFSADNMLTQLTLRTNKFNNARGIRLGNTFISNHGTKTFRVAAIPSNELLTLTYIDPSTKANMTCSDSCPLLQDTTVPYQDFLFPDSTTLTGAQITLLEWDGDSAGLHLLQLLSDGAFASAITDNNGRSCYSPDASGVYQTGKWSIIDSTTTIAGTTETMLEASVAVGTTPANAPTLTWFPYVSASGVYNVYVYVPGCQQFADCSSRTSVDITISPGGGAADVTKTVDENVTADTKVLIYTGYVVPAAPAYTVSVKLALAANATGSGQNGKWAVIADRVQLELISLSTSGSGGSGGSGGGSLTGGASGFGFFEWNTGNSGSGVNATGTIANTSESSFDSVSTAFATALGSEAASAIVNAVAAASPSQLFLGGQFGGTSSNGTLTNIVSFANGGIVILAGGGLNDAVNALAYANGTLFVGGTFTNVQDSASSVSGLSYVAKYDVSSGAWSPLGGGLNGPVASISVSSSQGEIVFAGNFSETYSTPGATYGAESGGVATWDVSMNKWVSGNGLVLGSPSFVTVSSATEFIAGSISAVSGNSASGWAILSADKSGEPTLGQSASPLVDAALAGSNGTSSPPSNTTKSSRRRRGGLREEEGGATSWLNLRGLFGANTSPARLLSRDSTSELPTPPAAPAPAVLAMAFWTNQSTSHESVVLGGNFSFVPTATGSSSSLSSGVALYDTTTETLAPLEGPQINGTVYSLLVQDHSLWVGGNFTVGSFEGLALYDLYSLSWQTSIGTLSGMFLISVRSITNPPQKSQSHYVIVAGTFAGAGSVSCQAVCAWDTSASKWVGLGNGIQGEVASVDYAEDGSNNVLVVAGAISLQDGTSANVAKYYFSNSSWVAVGSGLPGPVTAVSVNNENVNDVFAAGRSTDGTTPFVMHFDGSSWTSVNTPLTGASTFSQMTFVPLLNSHSSNNLIHTDRVLMVSGALDSSTFGNVSSALFDGQTWYPYLTSTTSSGATGAIAGLYHSFTTFSFTQRTFLATGVVILISIAIAAGIVFFLLLAGVLWTLLSRDSSEMDHKMFAEEDDASVQEGPSSMLEHINAATRSTFMNPGSLGTAAGAGALAAAAGTKRQSTEDRGTWAAGASTEGGHTDADGWRRTETPATAAGAGIVGTGHEPEEEVGRPAFARYSFDGEGEGELPLQTGVQLAVLDDRDPAWWYVRDENTGREGIVPAAYLY
ncbi:hypothetical protein DL93DRAFT_2215739 [Clavulina sp. PMI_390]|nr:hypothetical protein DL93DRAFT_2215739 [Clavulina sp. PMI_390]